jgi:inner membrane transporter RhtA
VLLVVLSVQLGAALAKELFAFLGPAGTVFLRVGLAALVMLALQRPRIATGRLRAGYFTAIVFGLTLALMNLAIYLSFERIPLGIAVTLEFIGPLGVAIAGSRQALDLLWAALAAAGIVLLAPLGAFGTDLDPLGVALALVAGLLWAAYIILAARTARLVPVGAAGLTIALCVGTLVLMPVGLVNSGSKLLDPGLLLAGLGVALFSSVVPCYLELAALRRLPARTFGILMSLEPAVAATAGFVILGEVLSLRAVASIALVTAAAAGASTFHNCGPCR